MTNKSFREEDSLGRNLVPGGVYSHYGVPFDTYNVRAVPDAVLLACIEINNTPSYLWMGLIGNTRLSIKQSSKKVVKSHIKNNIQIRSSVRYPRFKSHFYTGLPFDVNEKILDIGIPGKVVPRIRAKFTNSIVKDMISTLEYHKDDVYNAKRYTTMDRVKFMHLYGSLCLMKEPGEDYTIAPELTEEYYKTYFLLHTFIGEE